MSFKFLTNVKDREKDLVLILIFKELKKFGKSNEDYTFNKKMLSNYMEYSSLLRSDKLKAL